MKKIGKSVGRRKSSSIAKQVMNHRRVRECVLRRVGKLIRKDMECACKMETSSMLRKRTVAAMKSFCWRDFVKELEATSPVFCAVLKECVERKRRKVSKRGTSYKVDDSVVIGMCAAILLRHRNSNMNLVQRILSTLMYGGHAPKKVHVTCMHAIYVIIEQAILLTVNYFFPILVI